MATTTLHYVRPADLLADLGQPDIEVSTRSEVVDGQGRTMRVHAMVIKRISHKVEELVNSTPPGETVQLAGCFRFDTLSNALDLIYSGYITVPHDDAEDVDDLVSCWRAQHKLHEVTAPQAQAED